MFQRQSDFLEVLVERLRTLDSTSVYVWLFVHVGREAVRALLVLTYAAQLVFHVDTWPLQISLCVQLASDPALPGRHLPAALASENWQLRT